MVGRPPTTNGGRRIRNRRGRLSPHGGPPFGGTTSHRRKPLERAPHGEQQTGVGGKNPAGVCGKRRQNALTTGGNPRFGKRPQKSSGDVLQSGGNNYPQNFPPKPPQIFPLEREEPPKGPPRGLKRALYPEKIFFGLGMEKTGGVPRGKPWGTTKVLPQQTFSSHRWKKWPSPQSVSHTQHSGKWFSPLGEKFLGKTWGFVFWVKPNPEWKCSFKPVPRTPLGFFKG